MFVWQFIEARYVSFCHVDCALHLLPRSLNYVRCNRGSCLRNGSLQFVDVSWQGVTDTTSLTCPRQSESRGVRSCDPLHQHRALLYGSTNPAVWQMLIQVCTYSSTKVGRCAVLLQQKFTVHVLNKVYIVLLHNGHSKIHISETVYSFCENPVYSVTGTVISCVFVYTDRIQIQDDIDNCSLHL